MRTKTILHTYVVRISDHHTIKTQARSAENAKKMAWEDMEDSYTYGYRSEADFMAHATAKRVD